MKTSNKLLLSALVVLLVSLTIYNSALKAEFVSGNYKSPYVRYANKEVKDFNEVQIDAVNLINVTIRKGEYGVHTYLQNTDEVKITKIGKRLIVGIDFSKSPSADDARIEHYNQIIITCPQLVYAQINKHEMRDTMHTDKNEFIYDESGQVDIRRFSLDSLTIQQNAGIINIGKCNIGTLKSTASNKSKLKIEDDTYINKADLHINDHSLLELEQLNIPQFNYTLADSATLRLTSKGAMLKDALKKL